MATLNLTGSFSSQTVSPVAKDWTTVTGSYIQTALDASQFTETAIFVASYTFPDDVVISSAAFTVTGNLLAGGATSANLYLDGGNVGPIGSSFSNGGAAQASLSGRTLTVTLSVGFSNYAGSAPTATVNNPTFSINYTLLPNLHNLGVNF